jgi:uncharacterized protein (TIGR02300 family)
MPRRNVVTPWRAALTVALGYGKGAHLRCCGPLVSGGNSSFSGASRPMVKPEWGTKRTCPKCGTRFYDLTKEDPVVCINCGNQWTPESILKSKQPLPFDAPKKDESKDDDDLEVADIDLDVVDEDAEKSPDDEVDLGGDDDLGVDTGQGDDDV